MTKPEGKTPVRHQFLRIIRALRRMSGARRSDAGSALPGPDRACEHDNGARRAVQDYATAPPDHARRLHGKAERAAAGVPPDAGRMNGFRR